MSLEVKVLYVSIRWNTLATTAKGFNKTGNGITYTMSRFFIFII